MILYQSNNSLKPYHYDAREYRDFRYIPHLHRDLEIVYPISGQISITVEDNTTLLSAGELALILPNQIHSFETPQSSLVLVLVFSADFVPQFSACIKENKWESNRFTLSAADERFVFEKLMGDKPPERLLLSACLQILCAAYWQTVKDLSPLSNTPSRFATLLHRMLEYVTLHYTEDITLRKMARALDYEEHYLSRCFHNCFHMNFKRFVNEYRIQFARHLLEHCPPIPIIEIAYVSGFGSVRNFNRAYRAIVGTEPRKRT